MSCFLLSTAPTVDGRKPVNNGINYQPPQLVSGDRRIYSINSMTMLKFHRDDIVTFHVGYPHTGYPQILYN